MKIYFENDQEQVEITYSLKMLIRRAVLATLAAEGVTGHSEVSVTFTDNEGIRALNRRFREVDAPTDVLSFPLFEDGFAGADFGHMLGDIVLSLEKCRAQAEEFGHSFMRECAFLTVHSTLHLLGYDHETSEEDDADMRARQTAIVESMGLGVKESSK
ncbi:MAG: rRNA maturation RNase YbeY [Ruminococcaceae bacterium]|nr:rRNA maturation RNase YbeY [Oscillospiraceae bacterium]